MRAIHPAVISEIERLQRERHERENEESRRLPLPSWPPFPLPEQNEGPRQKG